MVSYPRDHLFYFMDYNPIFYLFCCSNCFNFVIVSSFRLAPVSFWHAPSFFNYFFSGIINCSYIFPSPALESTTSLRSHASFYWKVVFRHQDLATSCAHCYWDILAYWPSQQIELDFSLSKATHIDISDFNLTHRFHSSFFYLKILSLIAKIWLSFLHYIYLCVQPSHVHKMVSQLLTKTQWEINLDWANFIQTILSLNYFLLKYSLFAMGC